MGNWTLLEGATARTYAKRLDDPFLVGEQSHTVILWKVRDYRFIATCSCGWESPIFDKEGLAEASFHLHINACRDARVSFNEFPDGF